MKRCCARCGRLLGWLKCLRINVRAQSELWALAAMESKKDTILIEPQQRDAKPRDWYLQASVFSGVEGARLGGRCCVLGGVGAVEKGQQREVTAWVSDITVLACCAVLLKGI